MAITVSQNVIVLVGIVAGSIAVIMAGIFTIRTKTAKIWESEAIAEKTAKERIEGLFEESREEIHQLRGDLATEKMKTDITPILVRLVEIGSENAKHYHDITTALQMHDEHSASRDEAIVNSLKEIQSAMVSLVSRINGGR